MKILLRTLLYLALSIWVGAEFFFPFVAARVFLTLKPDTHTAGRIVGPLLNNLHVLGLIAALLLLLVLTTMLLSGFYRAHHTALMMTLVVLMATLTLYSEFVITPAMERDRVAAGGTIDNATSANSARLDFRHLHEHSERVEGVILISGLFTLLILAQAERLQQTGQ